MILSDDDPYTSAQDENASLWVERLGASVRRIPAGGHLNAASEPLVLERILAALDA